MPKSDEFITLINTLKAISPTISDEQRVGLLRQGVNQYGLRREDAEQILSDSGLVIGESLNYFEVLGLPIAQMQTESAITAQVDAAHRKHYSASLNAGGLPRPDGKTQEQWRVILNQARDILKDPQKRREHIATLQPNVESTEKARVLFKFPNGDEVTNISQLAALMEKNPHDAINVLYSGDLEQNFSEAGETNFANAAQAVVNKFPKNRDLGFLAMIQILQGKLRFRQQGSGAETPQEIARLIDQNWEQAKIHLYSGFIALWLEYTKQPQLVHTAKTVLSHHKNEHDIGLEEFVQKLNPQIGQPKLRTNHTNINFGKLDAKTKKTFRFEIVNDGRGFLYGTIKLAKEIAGLQISPTDVRGDTIASVKLDPNLLTSNKTHQTTLVIDTNGGNLTVPISCYVVPRPTEVSSNDDIDVNARDNHGMTALHRAATKSIHETALLVEKGADINAKDKYDGATPLHWAAEASAHEIVTFLLKNGANVNIKNGRHDTPLHCAVESVLKWKANSESIHKTLLILLKKGADINARGMNGNTPLCRAAWFASHRQQKEFHEIMKVLLENGADANAPVLSVANKGDHETMAILLKNGADANTKYNNGDTPLHWASRVDIPPSSIPGLDLDASAKKTRANACKTVLLLLENGADVNAKDNNNDTPLHWAVEVGAYKTALLLLVPCQSFFDG